MYFSLSFWKYFRYRGENMWKRCFFLMILCCLLFVPYQKPATEKVTTSDAPKMYLTFDDGPNEYTEQILDILDAYDIKATFFVTATRPDCFYLIKEAYEQGHTIGLHAYKHEYSIIYQDKDSYFEDLEKIAEVVTEMTGEESYYVRFPGGSSNLVSKVDMHLLIKELNKRGYRYFDWNGEIGDAKSGSNIISVMSSAMEGIDGSKDIMLLCHDKAITVEVLATLIEYYQELGYVFLPIDEDTDGFCHLK